MVDAETIVATVRDAFREEAAKWRRVKEHRRGGTDERYRVWREGYPDGELPPLETATDISTISDAVTYHHNLTYAAAWDVIAVAAWLSAIVAVKKAFADAVTTDEDTTPIRPISFGRHP